MTKERNRKAQPRAEETRSQILSSALALFRVKGFERTTMRDIAESAGIAVGASYYYFRSKEELVYAQYILMQEESEVDAIQAKESSKKLDRRIQHIVDFKLGQLAKDRELVQVLGRIAADPTSELSPFSSQSAPVRERAIAMMEDIIEGTGFKVAPSIRPQLPFILWLYYLATIFLWAHDPSRDQRLTKSFASLSQPLLLKMLGATSLPLTRGLTASVVKLTAVLQEFCGTDGDDAKDEKAKDEKTKDAKTKDA